MLLKNNLKKNECKTKEKKKENICKYKLNVYAPVLHYASNMWDISELIFIEKRILNRM